MCSATWASTGLESCDNVSEPASLLLLRQTEMQFRIVMDTITSRADRIDRSVCSRLGYPADIQLVVQTEVGGSAGVVASLSQFLCTDLQTLPQLVRAVSIGQQLPPVLLLADRLSAGSG